MKALSLEQVAGAARRAGSEAAERLAQEAKDARARAHSAKPVAVRLQQAEERLGLAEEKVAAAQQALEQASQRLQQATAPAIGGAPSRGPSFAAHLRVHG